MWFVESCPYHPEGKTPTPVVSLEHIIPFAIGGSNDFTIEACGDCNSVAGRDVDALLVDYPVIQIQRLLLNLKSTKSNVPEWKVDGRADFQGKEVRVSYSLRPSSTTLKSPPQVDKDELSNGDVHFRVTCDVTEARSILAAIQKRYEKRGYKLPLTEEIINQGVEGNWIPEIKMSLTVPTFTRPFAKIALGTGCFLFGDNYVQTNGASLLRSVMWAENEEEVRSLRLRGSVWPNLAPELDLVHQYVRQDEHFCLVKKAQGQLVFTCFLFGEIGCTLPLLDDDEASRIAVPDEGIVLTINPQTRRMIRRSFVEYLSEQMEFSRPASRQA